LRLNVGFLLNKNIGYSRNFEFDLPHLLLGEDLEITELHGSLRLTRTGQGAYGQGEFEVLTRLDCVRCLASFEQPLQASISELFTFPPDKAGDPLLAISESAILDLGPVLRELLLLDIPIRPVCRPDCLGLCPICGENRNEVTCSHPEAEIDPRLEVLKSLRTKS